MLYSDKMDDKCPMCGTVGKIWHKNPVVFRCPNCSSIYSDYGLVLEAEKEFINVWA
jgi:hypothetical protein